MEWKTHESEERTYSDVTEKPKRSRKRVTVCVLLAVFVLSAALYGVLRSPLGRYGWALGELKLGHYSAAQEHFAQLDGYRDANELKQEAGFYLLYQQAGACMAEGDYVVACSKYQKLGDFRDAKELAVRAGKLANLSEQYKSAHRLWQEGMLYPACDELLPILDEELPGVPELWAELETALYAQLDQCLEQGDFLRAMCCRDLLERAGRDQGVAERWDRAAAEQTLELATPYWESFCTDPPAYLQGSRLQEDLIRFHQYMELTGDRRHKIPICGTRPKEGAFLDMLDKADVLCEELLPVRDAVYWLDGTYWYNGIGRVTDVELCLRYDEADSAQEAQAHVRDTLDYCRDTVQALCDAHLLTKSMTNREKAFIIANWVCCTLDYDERTNDEQDQGNHDTWLALQDGVGVCESYNAIYNVMCNLAGVVSFSQSGPADPEEPPTEEDAHIWSVQLDENGKPFYTDCTWMDSYFSGQKITMDEFVDLMVENTAFSVMTETEEEDPEYWQYDVDIDYFWQEERWDSHLADNEFEEIYAAYQTCMRK